MKCRECSAFGVDREGFRGCLVNNKIINLDGGTFGCYITEEVIQRQIADMKKNDAEAKNYKWEHTQFNLRSMNSFEGYKEETVDNETYSEAKYKELIHYGEIVESLDVVDEHGHDIRVRLVKYQGEIWFIHLCNGSIVKLNGY